MLAPVFYVNFQVVMAIKGLFSWFNFMFKSHSSPDFTTYWDFDEICPSSSSTRSPPFFYDQAIAEDLSKVQKMYLATVPECNLPYKFSRKKFKAKNLSFSYFVIPEVGVFRQMHMNPFRRADGVVVPEDDVIGTQPKPGFLGEGKDKTVYKILSVTKGAPWTRGVLKKEPDYPQWLTHLETLRQYPEIHTGYFFEYQNSFNRTRRLFLAEYMNLGDLNNVMVFYNLGLNEKGRIGMKMARAVARMHSLGLCHGDIKLDNFFAHDDGNRIVDVRLGDIDFTHNVEPDLLLRWGTVGMVDPGLFFGEIKGEDLFKADIFSLGVSFFLFLYRKDYFYDDTKEKPLTSIPSRADFEEGGFFTESEAITPDKRLVWEMCDPDPKKRPAIDEVVARLEKIFT